MKKILVSTPHDSWSNDLRNSLHDVGFETEHAINGREAQLKIYQNNYYAVLLDFETKDHSCLEVLKYIKLNHSPIIVFLYFSSKKLMQENGIDETRFLKLGISKFFIGQSTTRDVSKHLSESGLGKWKSTVVSNSTLIDGAKDSRPASIQDAKMTRIKISNFIDESVSIFDHYLKLADNKYIKILNKGNFFDSSRLKNYIAEGVEYFYFQTKDRAEYINYMNSIASKITFTKPEKAMMLVSDTTNKFIEEIYTAGIQPKLIEEGLALCKSLNEIVKNDVSLNRIMDEYKEMDPSSYSHLFLVSFFSMVICHNLEWAGAKTKETIGLAALLHDIGMLKVPEIIRNKNPAFMSSQELSVYQLHPLHGYEMLQKFPCLSEQVKQIVYQHHEKVSGSGFPNKLTGLKIYPLAKIVSLADAFADILVDNKLPPLEGAKLFLGQRERIVHYDPLIMRALVAGLLRNNKNTQ